MPRAWTPDHLCKPTKPIMKPDHLASPLSFWPYKLLWSCYDPALLLPVIQPWWCSFSFFNQLLTSEQNHNSCLWPTAVSFPYHIAFRNKISSTNRLGKQIFCMFDIFLQRTFLFNGVEIQKWTSQIRNGACRKSVLARIGKLRYSGRRGYYIGKCMGLKEERWRWNWGFKKIH